MGNNTKELNVVPKVTLSIKVLDKNGNVVKEIVKENDPLTRWALRSLYADITGANTEVKDESGVLKGFIGFYATNRWTVKIAIGLDNTEPSFEDYKLLNKEREVSPIATPVLTEENTTAIFEAKYDFSIDTEKTYYEFGLFGIGYDGSTTYFFLVSRDVVSEGITVPANAILRVVYRIILGSV
jgi:hypothetical protein